MPTRPLAGGWGPVPDGVPDVDAVVAARPFDVVRDVTPETWDDEDTAFLRSLPCLNDVVVSVCGVDWWDGPTSAIGMTLQGMVWLHFNTDENGDYHGRRIYSVHELTHDEWEWERARYALGEECFGRSGRTDRVYAGGIAIFGATAETVPWEDWEARGAPYYAKYGKRGEQPHKPWERKPIGWVSEDILS